ncbi:MAG: ATP-binding cassette domain-containing protein, partial [Pseudomonadota bacterium]
MTTAYLDITGMGMEFDTGGEKFRALQNVNLKMAQGEFVSLIGHSGCGKSTVLNIIA